MKAFDSLLCKTKKHNAFVLIIVLILIAALSVPLSLSPAFTGMLSDVMKADINIYLQFNRGMSPSLMDAQGSHTGLPDVLLGRSPELRQPTLHGENDL